MASRKRRTSISRPSKRQRQAIRNVQRLIGESQKQRGYRAEDRVARLLESARSKGLLASFYAVPHDSLADHRGCDFFIAMQEQPDLFFPLQVKSSSRGKEEFERKRQGRVKIPVLVVRLHETDEELDVRFDRILLRHYLPALKSDTQSIPVFSKAEILQLGGDKRPPSDLLGQCELALSNCIQGFTLFESYERRPDNIFLVTLRDGREFLLSLQCTPGPRPRVEIQKSQDENGDGVLLRATIHYQQGIGANGIKKALWSIPQEIGLRSTPYQD